MLAYILDSRDLTIKDILEFERYSFAEDIEYSNKSSITVSRKPVLADDDFVFCKDGDDIVYVGICDNYNSGSNTSEYEIKMLQKENLFNRSIFVESEQLIADAGIEDFIVEAIRNNFTASGDEIMDKAFMNAYAETHTPVAAKVDADQGVFNLKTYLGNAKQYYGIFIDFVFAGKTLSVRVYKKEMDTIPIDIEVSDVTDYKETYEISVLARLLVNWKIPDSQDESGNTIVGATSRRNFFLLDNRTITEEINDADRAAGMSKSVLIEAETEAEMLQKVYNEFKSNRYNHKISFYLNRTSKLYPEERFFVGRKTMIKTKSGVRESMITKAEVTSESAMKNLTFGNLKTTLIEKLRR